jgi:transposase
MAAHHDGAVLPTRPRRPRDRAKVEACVLIVERWLFGRQRHRDFHSLAELNAAIADLLADLNDRRIMRREPDPASVGHLEKPLAHSDLN